MSWVLGSQVEEVTRVKKRNLRYKGKSWEGWVKIRPLVEGVEVSVSLKLERLK